MLKRQLCFSVLCQVVSVALVCVIFGTSFADVPDTRKIVEAAQNGMLKFLNQIPENQGDQYGFPPGFQSAEVSIGTPFQLYELLPSKLAVYTRGTGVQALVKETGQWYCPVILDHSIRCFLIVERVDASFEAVSLGYGALAGALSQILKTYPRGSGNSIKLIRSYQAGEYLFTIPEKGAFNLTPIDQHFIDGETVLKNKAAKLKNIDDTVKRLKPLIEKQLNSPRQ